ncbi:MAG: nuclear transport factor 2 family protein [Pseudomonadota bacterium]
MMERWQAWIAAFDKAVETDDWQELDQFLTPDVTYTVSGVPFACSLAGRAAVLGGFRKSIANFDRHFDQRWWFGVGVRVFDPGTVTARAMGVYRLGDKPLLHFSARSMWRFEGDRIVAMNDWYDLAESDVQNALAWLGEHAPDLDASYEQGNSDERIHR